MEQIIGIDFDNTLISYDEVFYNRAIGLGLIEGGSKNKKQVRDTIRLLTDGEMVWQHIQAYVYGQGISQALLNAGVRDFLKACTQKKVKIYVVSHKTEYSPLDPQKVNLRQAALSWMAANGFFDADGLGLNREQVFFEATRSAKIGRLKTLGCTHFIDDLQEVFLEEEFPAEVKKLLYSPALETPLKQDIVVVQNWKKIYEYFFNG